MFLVFFFVFFFLFLWWEASFPFAEPQRNKCFLKEFPLGAKVVRPSIEKHVEKLAIVQQKI
jgi:hypothetical protein